MSTPVIRRTGRHYTPPPHVAIQTYVGYCWRSERVNLSDGLELLIGFLLFSGADILAVNADQSISFDICEERSECLFYLQNEMRRAGITQKDIDKARKSQEVNLIEHCKKLRFVFGLIGLEENNEIFTVKRATILMNPTIKKEPQYCIMQRRTVILI